MDNISTYFNAQEIANYADEMRKAEEPALWEILFPPESAPSLELKWIKSPRRKVMALELSALDAHANRRGRLGAQRIIQEMPFFRELMAVSETDRQQLLLLADSASNRENDIKSVLSPVYDEHGKLVLGAYANADIMAGMLISGARIQIATDEQTADYNYDDNAGTWAANNVTQLTGTATWTTANKATSDPLGDILAAIEAQNNKGYKVARIIMNSATFKAFCDSDSIHKSVAPLGGVVRKMDARELLSNETEGAEVIIYNRTYEDSAGNTVKVIPDNCVILTGEGNLGRMYFGPTPEIFDKNHNKNQEGRDIACSQSDGVDCVGIECFMDNHPLVMNTVVSLAALPSFPEMDSVAVIKVQ
ncbi:MAG: major capsid protein [Fibrobacter sp.]|nr:major capsid protein [Fibrobacter sp.]